MFNKQADVTATLLTHMLARRHRARKLVALLAGDKGLEMTVNW